MPESKRKGIYLLPNLLTTGGLFSGFYAVVSAMNGHFESAAIAIFVAMLFDGLDGRVARMTNTQSDFGAEYDSMADMVSFGIAPALVAYTWGLTEMGKLGWLAAFIYVAGAALRLARFNTQIGIADKRYFQGLASPAAAALVAGLVWVGVEYDVAGDDYGILVALLTAAAGLLMISNFKYNSFKEVNWHGKVPFVALLVVMLILWLWLQLLHWCCLSPSCCTPLPVRSTPSEALIRSNLSMSLVIQMLKMKILKMNQRIVIRLTAAMPGRNF